MRTDIAVSESALRVSCRPYLLSVRTRVYCSSCLVVVCSFQDLSGHDIHYITEVDFHLSCCARSFSSYRFSWEKSWMFCENCACRQVLRVSYCVVQSCRVCVACSSCTVIFFVFFFMIMFRVSCMFYSTLCLKMGAYFQNVFELNTAKQASSVRDTAFGGRFDLIKQHRKFGQLDTCILYDDISLGKGNNLNILWL